MSKLHNKLYNVALKLIKKEGREIEIISVQIDDDPLNPVTIESSETVDAVQINFENSEIDGSIIQQTDYVLMLVKESVVSTDSIVVDSGNRYSIQANKTTKPGDVLILQKLHVRGPI